MRGCNCGTVHKDAHMPGCSGFAVEYHRLTADNALLRADNARLREALEKARGFVPATEMFGGAAWPHPLRLLIDTALAGTSDEEGR